MPSGPSTRSATSLFLLFFGMFIDEYKKVLKQTQHRVSSEESDSHDSKYTVKELLEEFLEDVKQIVLN
ncbi:hypothetical protein B4144_4089 [Bacillus atrophaeus]|nr:hypothetical protein B4144_4089 [Bacillus atrophaeus]